VGEALALSTFPQAGRRADLGGHFLRGEGSFLIVAPQASLALEDGVGPVGILADFDARLAEIGAQRALRNLQFQPFEAHAIVVADVAPAPKRPLSDPNNSAASNRLNCAAS
jgi:hypothetical protein